MQRLLMALWACLACLGIVTTPKTGLTQPVTQISMRTVTDDAEHHFFDYWMMANEGYLLPATPRRLSLAQMENPLRWVRPGSEGLITGPAEILCANVDTRSLWLTCKQQDGSRRLAPFRSRCGGSPTILSLLGGGACERPSILTVEGRPVLIERRYQLVRETPATMPPTSSAVAPSRPVLARPTPVAPPSRQAQAPPMVVAPRNTEWPADALLLLALAAIVMVVLVSVIVHLYHGKKNAEASVLAMQESAQQRTAQTRATLLEVHSAREADREQVRTKIAPAAFGLAARLKKLEEQHAQAESHRDKLLGEVHTLNARIQDLEQTNAALREQAQPTAIVGDSEEVARLRHALADAEARLTVLTGQVEELENRRMRDDSTLAETLVHLASVEEELEKARAKEQDLLTQIAELRIQLEARQEPTEKLFPPKPSDPPPVMTNSRPPGDGHPSLGVPREPTPARGSSDGRQRRSTIPGPGGSPEPDDGFKSFDDGGPEEPTAVQEVPRPRAANPPGTVPSVPPAQHISGVHPKPATGS